MPISETPDSTVFPYRATHQELEPNRYVPLPTPADMKKRTLFGIPLQSFLTGQTVDDSTLQYYIDVAISEIEHTLDLYITPVEFRERHDYSREMQFWSFGYLKIDHSPIQRVKRFALTFNNGIVQPGLQTPKSQYDQTNTQDTGKDNNNNQGIVLIDIPLEFIHTQPQEGTVQLVPANGVTISGFVASLYSGLGFHAFNSQTITNWPGAIDITYVSGFPDGQVPGLLSGLIENLAALKFLSSMGPVLFPHNSTSIGIDGTSQSVGTLGPAFLQLRIKDLNDMIKSQMDIAKGYYQKRFLIDYI